MTKSMIHPVSRYSLVRSIPIGEATLHFVSGATAGEQAPYDIAEQTRIVFQKIASNLEAAGSRLADIVKITVFLADIREYDAYNAVRNEIFKDIDPPPASSGIQALINGPFRRVEIEAIAVSTRAK